MDFVSSSKQLLSNPGMSPLYARMLMGQKSGLESSYFKPTITDLLEGNDKVIGYSSLMDVLTINEENRLMRKVQELTSQWDDDIKKLRREMDAITSLFKDMIVKPQFGDRVLEISRVFNQMADATRETQGLGAMSQ